MSRRRRHSLDTPAVDGEGEAVSLEPEAALDEMAPSTAPEEGEAPEQDTAAPPEGYVPVVTRTPEALEDERVEWERVAFEARVAAVMDELIVSRDDALKIIAGP